MKKFNLSKGLIVGLLTFALSIVAFAAVGASADEAQAPQKTTAVAAEYNATEDIITAGSNAYVYVVKSASGNKLKEGQVATAQMANNKISISDLGIKGTNKDVYLYVCDREVEVKDGETVSANLTIKGNANKVVGVIDYTKADSDASVSVLSAYYVDKKAKKNVAIDSAQLFWSPEQEGTYYLANKLGTSTRKDSTNATVSDGFRGKDLADMLEAGGTIYIKQAGVSGTSGTAQFGSKVAKVKIAKQAKAPKVKIDVAKDTIALKNGFDFAVATKDPTTKEYTVYETWYTILPVLKTATVTEGIVGGEIGVYTPLDKKDANAGKKVTEEEVEYYSYTKTAYKVLSIDTLLETLGNPEGEFKIAVRKSATNKKPASAVATVEIDYKKEAPLVYTQDNVKGEFVVSTADEFKKKGLSFKDIVAYPGVKNDAIATTGFDKTFKIVTGDGVTGADEGSNFEYLVVDGKNYFAAEGTDDVIDWTTAKWKKFDPAKLKINEKLSGAYSTVKGKKIKSVLKAEAAAVADSDTDGATEDEAELKNVKTLLLVRRAGDKSTGKRASEAIELYVVKSGNTWSLYSTVSNGEVAYKHTVKFAKWTKVEETYAWKETAEPANIVLWMKSGDANKQYIDLPTVTDAVLYKASEVQGVITLGNAAVSVVTAEGANKGKYEITLSDNKDETTWMAVREYANIKIEVFTKVGDAEPIAVTAKNVTVTKGKIGNGNPAYFVGSPCQISITAPDIPVVAGKVVTAATTANTIDGGTFDDSKVTVTPNSAEEVKITLTYNYVANDPEPEGENEGEGN